MFGAQKQILEQRQSDQSISVRRVFRCTPARLDKRKTTRECDPNHEPGQGLKRVKLEEQLQFVPNPVKDGKPTDILARKRGTEIELFVFCDRQRD